MWWLFLAGCGDPPIAEPPGACAPAQPAWPAAITTLTTRLQIEPPLPEPTALNPAFPEGLQAAFDQGLGAWTAVAGDPHLLREDLAARGPAPDRRTIALFLQQTDAQLADAESPTRVAGLDSAGFTQSAARPQEIYGVHSLDAVIRAANDLHAAHPIDFALVTGDNADSAQRNETRWFVDVWDGTPVRADSGAADRQPDADCNDPLAELTPEGADFPWYAVLGNHDVLVQGNFPITSYTDTVLGDDAEGGTRDLALPGGPLAYATVADPERRLLDRSGLVAEYLETTSQPPGHGFTAENVADGTATWSARPVPGIRLVGLDTNPDGPGDPLLRAADRDVLVGALEDATAAGELVIVASHFRLGGMAVEGGGTVDALLHGYPNVVLSVVGHSHENRVTPWPGPAGGGFWEIETSSGIDWPQQARLIDVADNGDGTLSVFTTLIDGLAPEGSMPLRSRILAAVDLQSGWRTEDGTGAVEDRNLELVVAVPPGVTLPAGRDGVESLGLP